MQIRPGGEKLSDTKVGEFDRRPLLFRLSAMQPMQQTLPPIITDSVIRTTAACWRRNRLPSSAEQNEKERENSTYSISEETHAFFFPCCCQEMNKWLSMFRGQISHLAARFSQLILFSPYKAGNEISLCAASPHDRPPPSSLPFYQDILY